jgi:hypothetical protein
MERLGLQYFAVGRARVPHAPVRLDALKVENS